MEHKQHLLIHNSIPDIKEKNQQNIRTSYVQVHRNSILGDNNLDDSEELNINDIKKINKLCKEQTNYSWFNVFHYGCNLRACEIWHGELIKRKANKII